MSVSEALMYVGNTEESGQNQLEILKSEGLLPHHYVLEIGCGVLHLARYLIPYLNYGLYYAIDPNEWLRKEATNNDWELQDTVVKKGASFLSRDDFDASEFGGKFDYIFSHSVLSHASRSQFYDYMVKTAQVLKDDGLSIASFRLGEDTSNPNWEYPDVNYYTQDTMYDATFKAGLKCKLRSDIRDVHTAICPAEIHDWMEIYK